MKNTTLALFLLLAQALPAQTFSVRGKITDSAGAPLAGATVSLRQVWGDPVKNTAADADGRFELTGVGKGGYAVVVSLLGYKPLKKQITLSTADLRLDAWVLEPDPLVLKGVEVTEAVVPVQQKGDTTVFNAGAFKVMKDANADELVEKLPSVTVENGTLKAQGENVGQVLVDGKPFFGNDPMAALKNLPAEVIDKIQVFDQQSEQAQFTGFNDGNTTKTINIVTKAGMRNGQFGKLYAGYGYEDKYQAGGNVSYFDGDRRLSAIGMSNNINVQNFSSEDLLGVMGGGGGGGRFRGGMMGGGGGGRQGGGSGGQGGGGQGGGEFLVRPQGGIAQTHAVGLNYSDNLWGQKLELSASYFFNQSTSDAESETYRQYLQNGTPANVYTENNTSRSDNANHRFNARLEFKPDSLNSFVWRPRLSAQQNDGRSDLLGQTTRDNAPVGQTDNRYRSALDGLNVNNSLLWRHRFGKKGRTVSLDVSSGYAPKKGDSALQSEDRYFSPQTRVDSLDQISNIDVRSWNVAGNVEYTEPLGAFSQLLLNYRASYQQESSDKQTFDFFEPDQDYTQRNEALSNVFSNDYVTHQGGAGYTFSKGRDLNFNARLNLQWAELQNEKTFPQAGRLDKRFFNALPSAMLRYGIDKNRNLRIFYRTNTQLPGVEQLQEVLDNSNPLQLRVGNADLQQTFQQNLFIRYQATDPEQSSAFFGMIGGGYTDAYIGNATYLPGSDHPIFQQYAVPPGAQITQPVNLDGYWNVRSFVSYGRPIKPLKINLNADVSYNYTRTPGLVNDVLNHAGSHAIGVGLTLASNISEKVDFTLSARPVWNQVQNSSANAASTEYLSQNTRLKFNWIIVEGFVLRTDLTHTLYAGLSDGFDQNYWLWNLGIGKKIFKNQRGEITLAVNDLLRQNRNIQRTVTEAYTEDVQTNALQRFVMLSFTYNLRNFNTGKAPARRQEFEGFGPPERWRN